MNLDLTKEEVENLKVSEALTLLAEWLEENQDMNIDDFHDHGSCPVYHKVMQARGLIELFNPDDAFSEFLTNMPDEEYKQWLKTEGQALRSTVYSFCVAIAADMEATGEFDRTLIAERPDNIVVANLSSASVMAAIVNAFAHSLQGGVTTDKSKLH